MQNTHNEKINDATGVLLAGGKSTRMGRDKASIDLSGSPLYSPALELLCQHFQTVIIAGDRPDLELDDIPSIPDRYPGSALGGLHAGLSVISTDWIFVMPCDLPYPDARLLKQLYELREGVDAVVPQTPTGYEPVFALYHKRCLSVFEAALKAGKRSIFSLYPQLNVRFLKWHDMPEGWEKSLLNVNTPEDLKKVKEGLL